MIRATLVLLLGLPVAALAQLNMIGGQDAFCRTGDFASDGPISTALPPFRLAQLIGTKNANIHFLSDVGGCPRAGSAECVKPAYVVPGDKVIISRTRGQWACSWYQSTRRETVGWLPSASMTVLEPEAQPSLAKWMGEWTFYGDSLTVSRGSKAGELHVEGAALWQGRGDVVHTGEIDARATPARNTLALTAEGCKMWLSLVGEFLVAYDNHECGGMNVVFDGVYRRAKP